MILLGRGWEPFNAANARVKRHQQLGAKLPYPRMLPRTHETAQRVVHGVHKETRALWGGGQTSPIDAGGLDTEMVIEPP